MHVDQSKIGSEAIMWSRGEDAPFLVRILSLPDAYGKAAIEMTGSDHPYYRTGSMWRVNPMFLSPAVVS